MKERLCLEVERLGLSAVIMGSRGFGAIKRGNNGRLGSVSDYCVRHCVCPLVVVRYPDEKDGGNAPQVSVASAAEDEDDTEFHDASDNHKDPSFIINEYLDTIVDWIPSMQGIRLKDIPQFIHCFKQCDFMIKFTSEIVKTTLKSFALIINTFEKLEHQVLYELSSMFPPIYTIGPLHLLLNQNKDNSLKSIGSNLWKEMPECLEWLNSKEPNSVLYVNYGSLTVMTQNQLVEFAWGLANSNQTFLWIVRPDLVASDLVVIPPEFVTKTKERSLLTSWCPQEQVLSHPSIGGFLTHCGWNSIIESISSGVPMICWPSFEEQ
ncbi:hypothetical protein ACSBR2_029519 [Camellia fascicularis]